MAHRENVERRFWPKVDKNGPVPTVRADLGPCWLWTAGLNSGGYGQLIIGSKADGTHRPESAPRIAYFLVRGPIAKGLQPDHLCRVRCCVNPSHLEPVTQAVNKARGEGGRHNKAKSHCPQGHPYSAKNTVLEPRPNGRSARRCRICMKDTWTRMNRKLGHEPRAKKM